jgi:hypothetical protein
MVSIAPANPVSARWRSPSEPSTASRTRRGLLCWVPVMGTMTVHSFRHCRQPSLRNGRRPALNENHWTNCSDTALNAHCRSARHMPLPQAASTGDPAVIHCQHECQDDTAKIGHGPVPV